MTENKTKILLILLLLILLQNLIFGQVNKFEILLDSSKAEFKKDFEQQNFSKVVIWLEKAVAIETENTEAKYFLGYAYSRLNSKDGESMNKLNTELTIKASEQFESVNKLSPKYFGEIISLDPYYKITSEWGSLALSYLDRNKKDSANWALKEGRRRGGFGDYILAINRKVLDACNENAILISSGDSYLFPILYLQKIEKYRKDISIVNVSLLNTFWYPSYLRKNKIVSFDLAVETLDTTNYMKWKDTVITISDFSWTVKPSYYNYILRSDIILLSLLKENKFKRDVYFTKGFAKNTQVSLNKYLSSHTIVDILNVFEEKDKRKDFKESITDILKLSNLININSSDDISFLDSFRTYIWLKAYDYLNNKNIEKAKSLIDILDKYANENEYLYENEKLKEFSNYIREEIFK